MQSSLRQDIWSDSLHRTVEKLYSDKPTNKADIFYPIPKHA